MAGASNRAAIEALSDRVAQLEEAVAARVGQGLLGSSDTKDSSKAGRIEELEKSVAELIAKMEAWEAKFDELNADVAAIGALCNDTVQSFTTEIGVLKRAVCQDPFHCSWHPDRPIALITL